nr:hypothetical protein [Tanacetum cinerariifolium]
MLFVKFYDWMMLKAPPPPQAVEGSSILVHQVLEKCSALVLRVKGLESANIAQQLEILKLKARVKRLERLNKERVNVDIDEGIELVVDQEKDAEIEGRQADTQAEVYNINLDHSSKVLSMQEDDAEVQEAVEIVTTAKLMTEVVTAATTQVVPVAKPAVIAVSTPISATKPAAKSKVLKIVPAALAVSTRKRKGIVIRDPKEELHDDTSAETLSVNDKGKGILVEDPKPMKKKDKKEMDAEYVRKLQEEEESHVQAKDVQTKMIQYIRRYHAYKKKPQSESEARKNMIAYLKNTEGFKMAFFKGKTYDQILPIFQARYKIIRADDTHQLYTSFITLLKNFDREDLEDLWKIVKARFFTSKPTNFTDDYLLVTLKNMFEKTDAQDKLLTSCGVHIITFTTTMFVLLVEKKYPLSRFTLEQLVNVARLQVEEESEMSLELLRFTRQQLLDNQQG